MVELPIRSKSTTTSCILAATTTAFRNVIIMCVSSAATSFALPDGEENTAEGTVFHTDFHFELISGYCGTIEAEMFQIRVPIKVASFFPLVMMVCTRPSTADIPAVVIRR